MFGEYTFDNKVQLLLQQKYNIENIPSQSNMTVDNIASNKNQTDASMQLHDLSKPKRRQVKNACVNCQKACKKCDEGRPCQRCIKYNLTETCKDSIRKERKKGVKRGPYKRNQLVLSQGEKKKKKLIKDVNSIVSVPTVTENDRTMYPHKSSATQMSVLPNNKCDSTKEYVTPPPPPPPTAICSSQNSLSRFSANISSPYHNQFNYPDSVVYNNDIIIDYHHNRNNNNDNNNNNVNMMPSPMSNHIDTMTYNSRSPQHCSIAPQEQELIDIYSFYNSQIRNEQNNLNMYGTPIGSPIITSAAHHNNPILNTDLVIDSSWQPSNTEKFHTNFYC
ncbi:hypothetical protein BD770DRAFT_401142 [Pilaira anomala]|nr:hypothetical protein BD770DRAFT_401142 [Pilaira anomala]